MKSPDDWLGFLLPKSGLPISRVKAARTPGMGLRAAARAAGEPTMDFGHMYLTVSAHSFLEIEFNVLKNTLLMN